jgi:tripartite-type tricarboxylate transporter receptor subunit TctC
MHRRVLLAAPFIASSARAQPGSSAGAPPGFPDRPLLLVVPFSAGSVNDLLGRLLANAAAGPLHQTITVENRPGAGGSLGIQQVARSKPDGLTLAFVSASTIPINRALFRNLTYDPQRDLTPVVIAASTPNALVVSGSSPWRSLAEFIADGRARGRDAAGRDPGRPPLRYYSPGNGTTQHLSAVQVANATGIRADHIPYRGPSEGMTALLAGEIEWGFAAVPSTVALVREGRLRVLGVTGTTSPPTLPEVPPFAALGLPGFEETNVWYGISAPAATPPDLLDTLRRAFRAALDEPAFAKRLADAGFYPTAPMDGPAMAAFIDRQVAFWAGLVGASGATVD